MELIFATGNINKVKAISTMIPPGSNITVKPMSELGFTEDIPETQDTLSGNANQKSEFLYNRYKTNVFSEDSGLEIEALDNAPGVLTARYAGDQKNRDDNMNLVLKNLEGIKNRKARFRAVLSLILEGEEHQFEGIINGKIGFVKVGDKGFGYDPIFIPYGYHYSFAQLPTEVKYGMSHRKRAFEKMISFLLNR